MWRLLLVPILFVTFVVANTQAPNPNKQAEAPLIWNGNSLFDLCKGHKANKLEGRLDQGCFCYIAGVTQTVLINVESKTMPPICPGKSVSQEQIVDVATKWLDDHPREAGPARSHSNLDGFSRGISVWLRNHPYTRNRTVSTRSDRQGKPHYGAAGAVSG